jgi:quinol monooxygenase YgiN
MGHFRIAHNPGTISPMGVTGHKSALFRARRGQSEALGAALAALGEPTRLEAGCLNYDLHRSVDDGDVWFVYENWRSPEGFDAHLLSEHVQTFLKARPISSPATSIFAGQDDLDPRNPLHLNATSISNSNRSTPMLFPERASSLPAPQATWASPSSCA